MFCLRLQKAMPKVLEPLQSQQILSQAKTLEFALHVSRGHFSCRALLRLAIVSSALGVSIRQLAGKRWGKLCKRWGPLESHLAKQTIGEETRCEANILGPKRCVAWAPREIIHFFLVFSANQVCLSVRQKASKFFFFWPELGLPKSVFLANKLRVVARYWSA